MNREPDQRPADTVPTSLTDLGTWVSSAIKEVGWDRAAAETDKSVKQLKRYAAGAEPPFSVVSTLARLSNRSLNELGNFSAHSSPGEEVVAHQHLPSSPIRVQPEMPFDSESMEGDDAKFILVPRYDVRASAGAGAFADQNQIMGYLAFRRDWVRRTLGVDPNHLAIISAIGDSMEPTIRHGDVLLVQTTPVEHVIDGAVYVLARGDHLVVKRLQQFVTGALKVFSDNQAYETEVVDNGDAITICGRVLWMGRTL